MPFVIEPDSPKLPRRGVPPHQMPHGLLAVPEWVRQELARAVAQSPRGWAPEAVERALCDWTLQHYFEAEGYEVLYRQTPNGPDVVAVGSDESVPLLLGLPVEQQLQFTFWSP